MAEAPGDGGAAAFAAFASQACGFALEESQLKYLSDVLCPVVTTLVQSALETMPASPQPFFKELLTPSEDSRNPGGQRKSAIMRKLGYAGAYATLVDFIGEYKDEVPDLRFKQIEAAIEGLSRHSDRRGGISADQEHFRGHEEQFREVLPSLGIAITLEKGESNHFQHATEDSHHEFHYHLDHDHISEAEISRIMGDVGFSKLDSCGKDIQDDCHMIMHGLSAPYDLMKRYNIPEDKLGNWIEKIFSMYTASNPYHNWRHAFDVYQFTYCMLTTGKGANYFNYQDIMALLLAAVSHDVAHVGFSNAFLVNTAHPLALTYNDHSPLENMHAATFFEIMKTEENNFLEHMSPHDFQVFRSKVVECILATDMSHHFDLVDRISSRVNALELDPLATNTKEDREKQMSSKADRRLLMQSFTHMADLGHCARPWNVHKHGVVSVEDEFFVQGDEERRLGMPIMPMMDRTKDSAATGQSFFLDKLVRPLLQPYTRFFKVEVGDALLNTLESNKQRWVALVEKHGKKTARDLLPLADAEDAAAPLPSPRDGADEGS